MLSGFWHSMANLKAVSLHLLSYHHLKVIWSNNVCEWMCMSALISLYHIANSVGMEVIAQCN